MNRNACVFLAGLGSGIGLGMLLTPKSGPQTRSLIQEKASDGATYLRERGIEMRDAATDVIREGTRKVNKETEAVKAAVNAGKRAYDDTLRS